MSCQSRPLAPSLPTLQTCDLARIDNALLAQLAHAAHAIAGRLRGVVSFGDRGSAAVDFIVLVSLRRPNEEVPRSDTARIVAIVASHHPFRNGAAIDSSARQCARCCLPLAQRRP